MRSVSTFALVIIVPLLAAGCGRDTVQVDTVRGPGDTSDGRDSTNTQDADNNPDVPGDDVGPDLPKLDADCVENCGGGYACVDGGIVGCDETAPCGQCACDTLIDVAQCPGGCREGARADRVGDLCVDPEMPSCDDVCQERVDRTEDSGLCPFDYRSDVPCEAFCGDLRARFSPRTAEALDHCIENDPLCFQDVEDCVFSELYGDGAAVVISLFGSEFDDYEGKPVYGVIEEGNQVMETLGPLAIRNGGFVMEFEVVTWPGNQKNVYIYIDVDENERCDADVDVATVGRTERSDDYENPTYRGELMPDGRSHDFVCALYD